MLLQSTTSTFFPPLKSHHFPHGDKGKKRTNPSWSYFLSSWAHHHCSLLRFCFQMSKVTAPLWSCSNTTEADNININTHLQAYDDTHQKSCLSLTNDFDRALEQVYSSLECTQKKKHDWWRDSQSISVCVHVCKDDMIYEVVWTVAPFIISSIKSSQSWNEDVKTLQQTEPLNCTTSSHTTVVLIRPNLKLG